MEYNEMMKKMKDGCCLLYISQTSPKTDDYNNK